jgi:putative phosphoribosyl transferase
MYGAEIFDDRGEAGRALAARLAPYAGRGDVVVLALPRGGVPVGYEVAAALGVPLDVLIVRKLGVPGHEELAMGAVAGGGVRVLDEQLIRVLRIPGELVERVTARERAEVERRERAYRGGRPAAAVRGKTVIVVDDGIATGATVRAAVAALRSMGAARIVVAAPVAPRSTVRELRRLADEVACVATPEPFEAISLWYGAFPQTPDEEVRALLARAAAGERPAPVPV